MKPSTLLLAASLVANVALVGVYYSTRVTTPSGSAVSAPSAAAAKNSPHVAAPAKSAASAASAATDADTDAAKLSPEAAKQLALGRAAARYAAVLRANSKNGEGKWWSRTDPNKLTKEQREALLQARKELSDALLAATGTDFVGNSNLSDATLAFLPDAKRDQLRRILADYQDLMEQYGPQNGIQLASDKERLKLLRSERDRDIANLLSPDELADYEMRTSPSANSLRQRFGDAIANEDEFRKLYALQKAFDDKFPVDALQGRVTPEQMKARAEAAAQLQADMRAAVGDEAYAALKRASDSDLRTVDALVSRLNLPADTTDKVAALRDNYAAQSQKIMADAATPFPQRREQLQALATQAKSDLASTLGTEAADAYAQRSQWVSMMQSGIGFSTTPSTNSPGMLALGSAFGPSVFPVTPTGAGAPGTATRVISNVVTTSGGPGPDGGAVFFSGAAPTGSTQVMTYTATSTPTDAHAPTDGTVIKIQPPPPGSSAPPPKE